MSQGDSKTSTDFVGFAPLSNYARLMTAPNYGRGFDQTGISSKYLTCQSGLGPFDQNFAPSADCLEALSANESDRSDMTQRIYELTLQGGLFTLPAGQVRSAAGATYRRNDFTFKPDSLRELDYIGDTSAGAFGSGEIDAGVTVKEVYGEALVPVLKDLPGIKNLELELGYRYSDYSTGQKVDTYKILASWEPMEWMRVRGGYNRAERAPNIAELYQTPTGSAQFADMAIDPCRNDPTANTGLNVTTFNGRPSNQPATDPAVRAEAAAAVQRDDRQYGLGIRCGSEQLQRRRRARDIAEWQREPEERARRHLDHGRRIPLALRLAAAGAPDGHAGLVRSPRVGSHRRDPDGRDRELLLQHQWHQSDPAAERSEWLLQADRARPGQRRHLAHLQPL